MVLLNSATAITGSSTVNDQHFGVNYLVHLDGEPADAAVFANITNDLHGAGSVLFPGGTVGDVGTVGPDKFEGTADDVPALDISVTNGNPADTTVDFLTNAAANGWSVTFVLPMWRFLDVSDQSVDTAVAIGELTAYVAAVIVLANSEGVTIDGFELGNEWDDLTGRTSTSALTVQTIDSFYTAYAEFAADLAVEVQNEIEDATDGSGNNVYTPITEPFIAIQSLAPWMQPNSDRLVNYRSALEDAFPDSNDPDAAQNVIDAVLGHFYLSQDGPGGEIRDPATRTHFDNLDEINAIFGNDLDYLISEWNLHGSAGGGTVTPANNMGDGIQQLEPIVGMFHTMISEGVDYANFWVVRQSQWNSLYGTEILNSTTDVTNGVPQFTRPVRYAFDLLSDQLVGTQAIDLNGSAAGAMGAIGNNGNIHVYGFEDANSTVLYFGSRSATAQSIDLDLANYGNSSQNPLIQITRISVDDASQASHVQITTIETQEYNFNQFQALTGNFLGFSPYELISIEIVYNAGSGETEIGTNIPDLMFGTAGNDTFMGSAGAWTRIRDGVGYAVGDEIYGYFGNDTVDYSDSGEGVTVRLDTSFGTNTGGDADRDRLQSIENVIGSGYADFLLGDAKANILTGGAGDDVFWGLGGNDLFYGGTGADAFHGGNDIDSVSYASAVTGVTAYLDGTMGTNSGGAVGDTIDNIENLYGSAHDDTLIGNGADNYISGGVGADILWGVGGNDRFYGGSGGDAFHGGTGIDSVYFTSAATGVTVYLINGSGTNTGEAFQDIFDNIENLYGSAHDDVLTGNDGNNFIGGGDGHDILHGGLGNDTLNGGDDVDWLYGGAGADTFNGGNGYDTVIYANATAGVTVYHDGSGVNTAEAYGDVLNDIENIMGSDFGDVIFGDGIANGINGRDGNDWLLGGDGNDTLRGDGGADNLRGDGGNDTLYGGDGVDNLRGGVGNDLLYGEDGVDELFGDTGNDALRGGGDNDVLWGGAGEDDLQGDAGDDWLLGGGADDELRGNMGNDNLRGEDGNDSLIGGNGDDNLRGGDGADWLYGSVGNDVLYGDNDNDILRGAGGDDTLTGGSGNDWFVFEVGSGNDIITDFSVAGAETLDFHLISGINNMGDLGITAIPGGTLITFGGDSVTLLGVTAASLVADDFIFS